MKLQYQDRSALWTDVAQQPETEADAQRLIRAHHALVAGSNARLAELQAGLNRERIKSEIRLRPTHD